MFGKNLLPFLCLLLGSVTLQASWLDHWSVRGVVVHKSFRPTPLSHSLGVEGIYKLEVQDDKKKVHRQMVTREVFLAYEIGDLFDSTAPAPSADTNKERAVAVEKDSAHARLAMTVDDPVAPPAAGPRIASACFTQDMLPEKEGF